MNVSVCVHFCLCVSVCVCVCAICICVHCYMCSFLFPVCAHFLGCYSLFLCVLFCYVHLFLSVCAHSCYLCVCVCVCCLHEKKHSNIAAAKYGGIHYILNAPYSILNICIFIFSFFSVSSFEYTHITCISQHVFCSYYLFLMSVFGVLLTVWLGLLMCTLCQAFAALLYPGGHLTSLNLSGNSLDDAAACALGTGLAGNTTLLCLYLSGGSAHVFPAAGGVLGPTGVAALLSPLFLASTSRCVVFTLVCVV